MKKAPSLPNSDLKVKSPKGCYLVFWFFIVTLLGMLLVLFIKITCFSGEVITWE